LALAGGTHVGQVTDMKPNLRTWIGVPIVIVGAVGLLTTLLIERRLNQQAFAIGCVIVMVLAVVIWTVLLKRPNRLAGSSEGAGSSSLPNASKKKALQIVSLLLFLALVFWVTRGGPWIPRLIGASMLLLVTAGIALRKTK